jgi:hypothetical protein
MLDRSRLPFGLAVRELWLPETKAARPIALVIDLRRSAALAAVVVLATLGLLLVVVKAAFWPAFVALLVAWAAVAWPGEYRSGFYEVDEAGRLARFLGRSRPDLTGMRRVKT